MPANSRTQDPHAPLVNKPNGSGLMRIFKAAQCSLAGFASAWRHESAFRQELLMAVCLTPVAFVLASSREQLLLLIGCLVFILFAEMLNSAIEALADAITLEHHPLIGRAKDMGSACVFIALMFFALVWGDTLLRWL